MDVILTEWALDSYLNLKHAKAFTDQEYVTTLRTDAELLKDGMPSPHAKFQNPKFWGPATDMAAKTIQHGYKMKWHNIGSGKVQLRLAVVILGGKSYLCQGYVKTNDSTDKREMAKLKIRIRDIGKGHYNYRGML
jgi:hypothetical protein